MRIVNAICIRVRDLPIYSEFDLIDLKKKVLKEEADIQIKINVLRTL